MSVSARLSPVPLLLLLAASGCVPTDRSGSVNAVVFALDDAGEAYELRVLPVENLESLRELRGRDFHFRNGARLDQGFDDDLSVHEGGPFELEYDEHADGTVVPSDLHSLYALSSYRALDRASQALRAQGFIPLEPIHAYYFPELTSLVAGDLSRLFFTDNAAYLFHGEDSGFLFLPSFMLADLPLLLNESVVAHELGHAVIHQLLFGNEDEGTFSADTDLQSLHEGVADLIAVGVTGDPDGFRHSTGEIDFDRDLSDARDFTDADFAEMKSGDVAFDPHHQGSLLARAIYESWPEKSPEGWLDESSRARFLRRVLDSLSALELEGGLQLGEFPEAWTAGLSIEERGPACEILLRRLAPLASSMKTCGGGR